MPRFVYLLGLGLALLAVALAFTDWALRQQPGVTDANVRRIHRGMELSEVEAILGCPTCVREWIGLRGFSVVNPPPDGPAIVWETKRLIMCIWFDEDGRARDITVIRMLEEPAQDSPFGRLLAWFGW